MPLQDALQRYELALDALEKAKGGEGLAQQKDVLTALAARDAVQHWVEETPSILAEQLLQLSQLDDRLSSQKTIIVQAVDLEYWRSLLNPSESAWWWRLEPPALFPFLEKQYLWLDRLDWLWTLASLFFLTFAVTVVFETLNRVVGEGLNTPGLFPVAVQVVLTLAGGSAALTENGRKGLRSLMTRLRIPPHFWQEFSAIATLVVLVIVVGIHQVYLPQLATNRYQDGIAHYQFGRLDSALQAYQQSLALRPDFVAAHYSLGIIYEDRQQMDAAIAEYQRVVSQNPDVLDKLTWLRAHNNLGRLYILDGAYRAAWAPLERALNSITENDLTNPEIGAERYNVLKNLGWMWLEQGQFAEADEFLAQAIAQDPQHSAAHCLKAQALEGLEQKAAAIAAWANCLRGKRYFKAEEAEWAATARVRLEEATE